MADENIYCGSWKITKCISLAAGTEVSEVEGAIFTLDESGDLSWNIPENAEPMPFFSCETFEVFLGSPHFIRFFGAFAGHVIQFRVAHSDEDGINLIYEGWCVLQCTKLAPKEVGWDEPFSYLSALEEGYFSDAVITAKSGKQFPVHLTLLRLSCPAAEWQVCGGSGSPLDGLPEPVVETALHFVYTDCLPPGVSEETARACLSTLGPPRVGFERLARLCELFLHNVAVRQQVVSLVGDMHRCVGSVVDCFTGAKSGLENGPSSPSCAASAPARLCYVVGQALRECAVAASKLLLLCDLFSRHKHQLSREERHDLVKYCISRLPIFLNQLQKLLEAVKRSFGNLSFTERTVIAAYIVPEIESSLDSLFQLIAEAKCALDTIISRMTSEKEGSSSVELKAKATVGEVLNQSLRNSLNMRELKKLRRFYEKVFVTLISLMRKKESFCDMGSGNKIRSVAKKLEQFIDEIPMLLLRIDELRSAVLDKQSWKEWQFLFKLGTSKVAWMLNKLVCYRVTLRTAVNHLCDLVARDQFTAALVHLGIRAPTSGWKQQDAADDGATSTTGGTTTVLPVSPAINMAQGEPLESLCLPPPAKESCLAKESLQLFNDGKDTDMSFEILATPAPGYESDSGLESSAVNGFSGTYQQIEAHRVIVATRCNWFKKALLSGMRESIDRKIVVHDTHPEVFRLFLEYLYRGCLDSQILATDQLVELMQLGDRYEVDTLKQMSEDALRDHVDEDSALFLLNLADQLNARNLRNSAMEFVAIHADMVKSEGYFELPDDLQVEVNETITWFRLRSCERTEDAIPFARQFEATSPSSASSSLLDLNEFTSALNISGKEAMGAAQGDDGTAHSSSWGSLEELPLTQDSAQLEVCVEQLRDVVGEAVPREALVQVSLAADYDVNRALNFFFA